MPLVRVTYIPHSKDTGILRRQHSQKYLQTQITCIPRRTSWDVTPSLVWGWFLTCSLTNTLLVYIQGGGGGGLLVYIYIQGGLLVYIYRWQTGIYIYIYIYR